MDHTRQAVIASLLTALLVSAGCGNDDGGGGTDTATAAEVESDATGDLDAQADAVQPDTAEPDTAEPETTPDTTTLDTAAPDTVAPDTSTPDTSEPDTSEPDTTAPGACKSSADCTQPATGCEANVCLAGTCTPQTLADGTPCDDGKPCTAKAQCAAGTCQPSATVDCADGNPCSTDACDALTGTCTHTATAAGTACDDGNTCTSGTTCNEQGQCAGGANSCGCSSIKDCAAFDDGDPCNGTLYCNAETKGCQVLPSSVVICDPSGDGPCTQTVCAPSTGTCVSVPEADATACDDGNACTKGEACSDGVCKATVNTCQCAIAADCLPYDDGNACNGTLYCDTSALPFTCKVNPASVVSCPKPASACQTAACDAKTGACKLADAADGTACDDGNDKTVGDACKAGACVPGTSIAQCKADTDCAKFEDGDFCNGTLFCNAQTGLCQHNPATVVQCPTVDDTACRKNVCQPKTGLCALIPVAEGLACEDSNACTVGEVCKAGACTPSADLCQCQQDSDCAAKDDGNLCNGTLFCNKQKGTCELAPNTVVTCSKAGDTACSTNQCAPKTGKCAMLAAPDLLPCDDGDSCTKDEVCVGGSCAGEKICACQADADCANQEDGNLCNGTLYCNKLKGACEVNPATIKLCPTAGDTTCSKNACEPSSGACKMQPAFNGAACDADGNPCTANDYCDSGACKAGKSVCGCYVDADCSGKQGDDKCIVDLYCDKTSYTCKPTKVVECDTSGDSACAKTACDPKDGQCKTALQPEGTICGESAVCAGAQVCDAKGACVPGEASDCDDADACTADACDPKKGCTFTAKDSGACDDGSVCTSADSCKAGQCVGTAKDCSDDSPCTDDACDPAKGCVHLPSQATGCDDGDLCSVGDFCLQGLCLPGSKVLPCDDGNPCTGDSCDPKQGCVAKAIDGGKCDDGDGCTKADACTGGSCKGVQLSCDDGSGCTVDSCDKDEGCVHLPQTGTPCDDGNACTVGDACISSGLCASGQPKVCDDANPCTVDLCDPLQGCVTKAVVGSKCDDGNACTVNEKCEKGACTGSPRDCDDGLVCSKDTCDADAGCLYAVTAGSKCDDGNACTAGDTCAKAGACVPGPGLSCDDSNGCTTDACDPASGCTHKALDGIGCSDGDECTQADKCVQGQCKGSGKSCDDGLPCTTDGCDAAGGCTHEVQQGATCSDNNACTSGDACLASGYCKPGAPVDCDDGNACTLDVCGAKSGCGHETLTGSACDDGDACTEGETCTGKALCVGPNVDCDDGLPCTTDTCDKLAGCKHAAKAGTPCDDGNACTVVDSCLASGVCKPGASKDCADGNPCTADGCSADQGCTHTILAGSLCNDGNACTSGEACNGSGACVGSPTDCDDSQSCTKDSCDKNAGCLHLPLAATPCNDGNACTAGDSCSKAGTCAPGDGVNCDDGKPCTIDGCDAKSGCTHKNVDGIACDDGDACTKGDVCKSGGCAGSVAGCDDGLACTKDSCDSKTGCKHEALVGNSCSDGDACTDQDACDASALCVGKSKTCNDDNVCTLDTCNPQSGCVFTKLQGAACDDGKVCTGPDACSNGVCTGLTKNCDDGNECTTDSCDVSVGCKNVSADGKACNDGSECTTADACTSGGCKGKEKNCDDSNACTLESCNPLVGCLTTFAAVDTPCDDGDECSVDWCSGTGVCESEPRLMTKHIASGTEVHGMTVDSSGDAWIYGRGYGGSGGGFVHRVRFGGKQGYPQYGMMSDVVRHLVQRPSGSGYLAIGDWSGTDAPAPPNGTTTRLAWLDAKGTTQSVVTPSKDTFGGPLRWDHADDNGTMAAFVGVHWGASVESPRFYLGRANLSTKVVSVLPGYAPSVMNVRPDSRLESHGVVVLDSSTIYALVSVLGHAGVETWLIRWSGTSVTLKRVWSRSGLWGAGMRMAGIYKRSGSEFVVFTPHVERVIHFVDPFDQIHWYPGNSKSFQTKTAFAVRDGSAFMAGRHSTLGTPRLYGLLPKWEGKWYPEVDLPHAAASLGFGPKREIYILANTAKDDAPSAWTVSRRDPWGNASCSACMTEHWKGCHPSHEDGTCFQERCIASSGTCDGYKSASFCDDGNPCTTDSCASDGSCTYSNNDGAACNVAASKCIAGTGTCGAGVCNAPWTVKDCSTGYACGAALCDEDNGCLLAKIPAGTTCGTNSVCSSLTCLPSSSACKTTRSGASTTSASTHVFPFTTQQSATFRWLQLQLKVTSAGIGTGWVDLLSVTLDLDGKSYLLFGGQKDCFDNGFDACIGWPYYTSWVFSWPDELVGLEWIDSLVGKPTPSSGKLTIATGADDVAVEVDNWSITFGHNCP